MLPERHQFTCRHCRIAQRWLPVTAYPALRQFKAPTLTTVTKVRKTGTSFHIHSLYRRNESHRMALRLTQNQKLPSSTMSSRLPRIISISSPRVRGWRRTLCFRHTTPFSQNTVSTPRRTITSRAWSSESAASAATVHFWINFAMFWRGWVLSWSSTVAAKVRDRFQTQAMNETMNSRCNRHLLTPIANITLLPRTIALRSIYSHHSRGASGRSLPQTRQSVMATVQTSKG